MKNLTILLTPLLLLFFSGCEVTDKINENLLDIEDNEKNYNYSDEVNISSSKQTSEKEKKDGAVENNNSQETNESQTVDVDSNITQIEINSSIPNNSCQADEVLDKNGSCVKKETISTPVYNCPAGQYLENGVCIDDKSVDTGDFNLTIYAVDTTIHNQPNISIVMGKNDYRVIRIKASPQQQSTIELFELTTTNVVSPFLLQEGNPSPENGNDYIFRVQSNNATGSSRFRLVVTNADGFTHSVYVEVEVIDQIAVSTVRQTYTVITNSPTEQDITVKAYNLLGNPLKFEIVDRELINSEKKLILVPNDYPVFSDGTKEGVEFSFAVSGLEDYKRDIEIKVTDTVTNSSKSIWVTIESSRRNTEFYADLYECGEINYNQYEKVADINTPENLNGVYSADNSIYLKSTIKMSYDISNEFSTVMVFYNSNGKTYNYDEYGKEYLRNVGSGKDIAIIYYAKYLQGSRYFLKYYDESKNSVVCEKRYFGYLATTNTQPDQLSTIDVPDFADKPVGPEVP